jgi:hypothetical protein
MIIMSNIFWNIFNKLGVTITISVKDDSIRIAKIIVKGAPK